MSVIEKLIRFHKFNLDEKRRALRELEEQEAGVQKAIYNLDQEIQAEQSFSRSQADLAPYYGGYANRSKTRRDTLEAELTQVHQKVEASREIVIQAYEELKRYEITKDQQDHCEYLETERQSQIELDEVALTAHQRKSGKS
tara:strand:- start:225 stop:647 length:423 start_codon:yes stop_codon:yes gene_type:complete